MADNKVTTTVDPNTTASNSLENHAQEPFGAKKPMDHPCTMSPVDANYGFGGDGNKGAKFSGGLEESGGSLGKSDDAGESGPSDDSGISAPGMNEDKY